MPQSIDTSARIERADDLYQMLIDAHAGLDDEASMKLNAKLILILANQIAEMDILSQAIVLARENIESTSKEEQN